MPETPSAASIGLITLALVTGCILDGVALAMLSQSAFSRRRPLFSGALALLASLAIFTSWAILVMKLSDTGTVLIGVLIWEAIAVAISLSVAGAFLGSMLSQRRGPDPNRARWWGSIARSWSVVALVCALAYLVLMLSWDALLISRGGLDIEAIGETIIALLVTAWAFVYARPLLRKLADQRHGKRIAP